MGMVGYYIYIDNNFITKEKMKKENKKKDIFEKEFDEIVEEDKKLDIFEALCWGGIVGAIIQ